MLTKEAAKKCASILRNAAASMRQMYKQASSGYTININKITQTYRKYCVGMLLTCPVLQLFFNRSSIVLQYRLKIY